LRIKKKKKIAVTLSHPEDCELVGGKIDEPKRPRLEKGESLQKGGRPRGGGLANHPVGCVGPQGREKRSKGRKGT